MADTFHPGSMPAARSTNDEFRRGLIAGAVAGLVGGGVLGAIIGASMSDGRQGEQPVQMGTAGQTEDRLYGTDRPTDTTLPDETPLNEDVRPGER